MGKLLGRGILLIVLFAVLAIVLPSEAQAQQINVTSFGFEETSIIQVTNDSDEEINSLRIWLGGNDSFQSFKTERGWIGEKTPQGVIVFKSSEPIMPGESVKFGVKTDKEKPGINWKTIDKDGRQIGIGKTLPGELPIVQSKPISQESTKDDNAVVSITAESSFRIIPKDPNAGDTIRVTGDNFGASQEFTFYIDSKKLGNFVTDKDGNFITTMKIPENQKADRVDFIVKDKNNEEKKLSLKIRELENLLPPSKNIELTIKGIPNVIHRGDKLEIYGTGNPDGAITASITNQEGESINARTAEIDSKGNWKIDDSIIVPLDMPFGRYSVTVTDGREEIVKNWNIESDKVIEITSNKQKFVPGDIMIFNGTALPNKSIEFSIEDPLGKEVFSGILETDKYGYAEFEFPTSQNTPKGTYTIITTQEKETEFIFVGLGSLPLIPVNLEFDKLNYKSSDKEAIISLTGTGSDVVSLLIIDPSDKPVGVAIPITLQADGRGKYALDLKGYGSGVYTAIISKGNTKSSEIFAVGLQTGSGDIEISTTKLDYLPGDPILILGETGENILLVVTLIDPDGNEIKTKETFSDEDGRIIEDAFRIPSDAKSGEWTINVKSGSNFEKEKIHVLATLEYGMQVHVEEGFIITGYGKTITIKVTGASQNVEIDIISQDNEIIQTLSFTATTQGEINQPWIIPNDIVPGLYTFKATDAYSSAQTTFNLQ